MSSATPGTTATSIWKVGGREAPPSAQSPEQSAQNILAGGGKKRAAGPRDQGDVMGARYCFNPIWLPHRTITC